MQNQVETIRISAEEIDSGTASYTMKVEATTDFVLTGGIIMGTVLTWYLKPGYEDTVTPLNIDSDGKSQEWTTDPLPQGVYMCGNPSRQHFKVKAMKKGSAKVEFVQKNHENEVRTFTLSLNLED